MKILSDAPAERAILAGICRYGADVYFDIVDILSATTFTIAENQAIYDCLHHILHKDDGATIDVPIIQSAAQEIGIGHLFETKQQAQHLQAIFNFPVSQKNVRRFAGKIRKLEVSRLLSTQLENAKSQLATLNGDETITHILGIAEDAIFDFTSLLHDSQDNEPTLLGEGLIDYVKYLGENPVESIGITTGFPEYDKSIGGGFRPGTVNVIAARPKALSLDSKVYTPQGYTTIKDIKIGDTVCTSSGGVATVTNHITYNNIDKYKVTFADGLIIYCSDNHLWCVNHCRKKHYQTLSLQEIIKFGRLQQADGRPKWRIPLTKPVIFTQQKTELDPYIMGMLLGDGSFRHNQVSFTTVDKQLLQSLIHSLDTDYTLTQNKISYNIVKKKRNRFIKNKYVQLMIKYGLNHKTSHDKFIPQHYLVNSIQKRIALLQGLMDTNGSVTTRGNLEYTTVSIQLAKDVQWLVRSLGGHCNIKQRYTKCNNKLFKSYRLRPTFNDNTICFRLLRKLKRTKKRNKPDLKNGIVKIEKVGKATMKCITIDSSKGLFLTDNFIVTHNCGKTLISDNFGYYIAEHHKIPVLNLDTEMRKEDHQHRTLAMMTESFIYDIETGQYIQKPHTKQKILNAAEKLEKEKIPYYHLSIAGMPFEEQVAIMRRWLLKVVGIDDDGKAKPCVIIYDYLKLMTADGINNDLKEYQLLGFLMTSLHNFAVRYGVPFFALMQTNRDGINKESTDTASGSDRIIWLCSNYTIFKKKSDEEIAEDGVDAGNRKLVPIVSRHGAEFETGDYINCHMRGECAKIVEGKRKFVWVADKIKDESGFPTSVVDNGEDIPFK